LTIRYNPHRIEKQARKWPVSFSAYSLEEDIRLRFSMLWSDHAMGWADPFAVKPAIDENLLYEYGFDCARIAGICAQNRVSAASLLESSFKWLSRLDWFLNNSEKSAFATEPWLEAALQGHDQVIYRHRPYCAFALVRKALRLAPPDKNLDPLQKNLVISAVYPFCPLWARFNLLDETGIPAALPAIVEDFQEFACVRFSLPAGGWHWQVFERKSFSTSPQTELLKLKWVKKAAGNRSLRLEQAKEGLKICFV